MSASVKLLTDLHTVKTAVVSWGTLTVLDVEVFGVPVGESFNILHLLSHSVQEREE